MANSSDVIRLIEKGHRAQAEINATIVGEISTIKNIQSDMHKKQNSFNERISGYLETDKATNQIGGIEQISVNKEDIVLMKTQRKIAYGVFFIMSTIGGFVLKAFGFFKV